MGVSYARISVFSTPSKLKAAVNGLAPQVVGTVEATPSTPSAVDPSLAKKGPSSP